MGAFPSLNFQVRGIAGVASNPFAFLRNLPYMRPSAGFLRTRWPPWTWLDDIPACARNSNRKETPMSITVEEKTRLIKEFGAKDGDTGSPEVRLPSCRRVSRP